MQHYVTEFENNLCELNKKGFSIIAQNGQQKTKRIILLMKWMDTVLYPR